MANQSFTEQYEALPKIAKVLLQLFLGYIVSVVYRILRYFETQKTSTLVVGILCFFCFGTIFWVIDLITEITSNRITVFAD
jgi:hypothetical protein